MRTDFIRLAPYGATANCNAMIIGPLTLYFSYAEIVAFKVHDTLYCCENVWSATTGKHLKALEPDPQKRLKVNEFDQKLTLALEKIHFA